MTTSRLRLKPQVHTKYAFEVKDFLKDGARLSPSQLIWEL